MGHSKRMVLITAKLSRELYYKATDMKVKTNSTDLQSSLFMLKQIQKHS